jgi:putative tryptophan/tyrosine transport system substrate-binding protein
MRRRESTRLLGGAATGWPLLARAEQPTMPIVGFLGSRSPSESAGVIAAFRQGLQETGFVEGQNVAIAFRWAEGACSRVPGLAAELTAMRVAVSTTDPQLGFRGLVGPLLHLNTPGERIGLQEHFLALVRL